MVEEGWTAGGAAVERTQAPRDDEQATGATGPTEGTSSGRQSCSKRDAPAKIAGREIAGNRAEIIQVRKDGKETDAPGRYRRKDLPSSPGGFLDRDSRRVRNGPPLEQDLSFLVPYRRMIFSERQARKALRVSTIRREARATAA